MKSIVLQGSLKKFLIKNRDLMVIAQEKVVGLKSFNVTARTTHHNNESEWKRRGPLWQNSHKDSTLKAIIINKSRKGFFIFVVEDNCYIVSFIHMYVSMVWVWSENLH